MLSLCSSQKWSSTARTVRPQFLNFKQSMIADVFYFYTFAVFFYKSFDFFISRLSEMGQHVGVRMLDLLTVREKAGKREIKLLQMLIFIKSTVWKVFSILVQIFIVLLSFAVCFRIFLAKRQTNWSMPTMMNAPTTWLKRRHWSTVSSPYPKIKATSTVQLSELESSKASSMPATL